MSDAPYTEDPGKTHYHGCWRDRGHHNCAVHEILRLRNEVKGLVNAHKNADADAMKARAEVARLREALGEIADPFDESSLREGPEIARRALEADDE